MLTSIKVKMGRLMQSSQIFMHGSVAEVAGCLDY
jgi:hypothetical protein